jgi:catechol 2,3-dioxygenase-like lactoylglutathione lyase family enzyme
MLKSIDHVNIVVRDMTPMLAFYRDVLGLNVTKDVIISGDWIGRVVGLKDVKARVVYLEFGHTPTARIELIEYANPVSVTPDCVGQPHALGIRHMAFAVDDIDLITQRLSDRGVTFASDVMQVPSSQVQYAGDVRKRLVYFRDPEDNILELCEYRTGG